MRIPLIKPNPPAVSEILEDLRSIENSGIYSNYGPVNSKFEKEAVEKLFSREGACLTVNNATIGLMIAIKECSPNFRDKPYAIMPSFTFAATAHAAIWAGFTPILCDIDPETWLPSPEAENELIRRYADKVGVIVPYATFGNCLDLSRYQKIQDELGIPIVIDAAASLGSIDDDGCGFGSACNFSTVFSMHVTKTFSTAEAGLIYSNDVERIARLRNMGNFGFAEPRSATMPGINSKLSEIGAAIALSKLRGFDLIVRHRRMLADTYRSKLGSPWKFQVMKGIQHAYQFMPVVLPEEIGHLRDKIIKDLGHEGIGCAKYFSPHLYEQSYFRANCLADELRSTHSISNRILSLPIWDAMNVNDVVFVCEKLNDIVKNV